LSIAGILLWRWRSSLRRGCHIRNCYIERRGWRIIILIVSPQLSIGLHQRLVADGVLNLDLRLARDTDA
jgi:hypothetical protein